MSKMCVSNYTRFFIGKFINVSTKLGFFFKYSTFQYFTFDKNSPTAGAPALERERSRERMIASKSATL